MMKFELELKKHLDSFLKSLRAEYQSNKSSAKVVEKYLKGEPITPEDDLLLRRQLFDYLKYVGVVIPFVLIPGSSILLPFLVREARKRKIDLLPTAFSQKEEKDSSS